jgi:hypothetical protein
MLRCRRGTVAFATVVALVPLIGVVALGAEAGSWYVTKQHAQNAADAAAYSGALRLACSNSGSSNCDTAHDYVYRGKQFAAQNRFCNAGDPSYPGSNCASLPSGTTQTVQIDLPAADRVRAIVSQQQPGYLAKVLGLSTVNIGATAIAQVQNPKDLCILGLGSVSSSSSALTIAGSSNITGNGCGLMSNDTVKYASAATFSGSGWAVDAVKGCVASAGHCDPGVPYNYNMLPATNPLAPLNSQSFNSRTGTGNNDPRNQVNPCPSGVPAGTNKCYSMAPNSGLGSTAAYTRLSVTTGEYVNFAPGTYFFYGAAININGGTVTCTACTGIGTSGVTLVLLGNNNSSLSITGGASVNLVAPETNAFSSALNGVLIDDQAPNASNNKVIVNGDGNVRLGGAMYFPNVDVSWGGTAANTNTTCSEVIANTVTITGNAYISTANCAPTTIAHTQVVALIQ